MKPLCKSEYATLLGICSGLSNKEIASAREVSVRTVEAQRERLYRKFGLKNCNAITLFIRAIENGIVEAPKKMIPAV